MRAYVIKKEDGKYEGPTHTGKLNEAYLYSTKKQAEKDWWSGVEIIPIDITIAKKKKKGKQNG